MQCRPLRERVFRGTIVTTTSSVVAAKEERGAYKKWSGGQMDQAVSAVVGDGKSIRRAAMQYNVPRSTLFDRVSGRIQPGAVSGPPKYLTFTEEAELAKFLSRCGAIGYARSKSEILALVQRVLDSRGKGQTVTHGWWDSFRRRHPELVVRSPVPLSHVRSKATDPEMLQRYFDLLEETVKGNKLEGRPGQIFNMDESGMPLDPKAPRLIFQKGSSACALGSGDKSQITIVACASAAGFCLPPMVIWDRKTLAPELAVGELPGTIYGLSSKGWIDCELFDVWFNNHFLRYIPSARPVLLLLDGHSSHFCPDTIRVAAQHKVLLFALPPNTTHISQPLDKGCFGPLKEAWRHVCHEYLTANPGKIITRYEFSRLFSKAWMGSMTISNITAGFRVTGIYPLDREAVLGPISDLSALSEETGLSFIPMISPAVRRFTSRRDVTPDSEAREQDFSDHELALFEHWYDEGHDITDNERYNTWLAQSHPTSPAASHVWMQPLQSTGISELLSYPEPPSRVPTLNPKSCGRVLTSQENLLILEEKKLAKEEKEREKEARKRAREEKKSMKEAERRQKKNRSKGKFLQYH